MKRAYWVNIGRVVGALFIYGEIFVLDSIPVNGSNYVNLSQISFSTFIGLVFGVFLGGATTFYLTYSRDEEVKKAKDFNVTILGFLILLIVQSLWQDGWDTAPFLRGVILSLYPFICALLALLRVCLFSKRKVSQENPPI